MQGVTITHPKEIIKKRERGWFTVRSLITSFLHKALGLILSSLCSCNSVDLVILHPLWWKQEDSIYLQWITYNWNQKPSLQCRIISDLSEANGTVLICQYNSTFCAWNSSIQIQRMYKADLRCFSICKSHFEN